MRFRWLPVLVLCWLAVAAQSRATPDRVAIVGGGSMDYLEIVAACADGGIVAVGTARTTWKPGGLVHCVGPCGGPCDVMVWRVGPTGRLLWCTIVGGSGEERLFGVTPLGDGSVIVVGDTKSPDFPASPGRRHHGKRDLFAMRIRPDGKSTAWSVCIGGPGDEVMYDYLFDPAGAILLCGDTGSSHLDGARAFGPGLPDGYGDGCVVRLDLEGRQQFLTIMGGRLNGDYCASMLPRPGGDLVVAGHTWSPDLVTTPGAYTTGPVRIKDSFVTRLDRSGAPRWTAQIGGDGYDMIGKVLAGPGGNLWLLAISSSYNLPVTPGAAQPRRRPGKSRELQGVETALAQLSSDGSRLLVCTYLSTPAEYELELYGRRLIVMPDGGCMVVGTVRKPEPANGKQSGWPWRPGDQAIMTRRFDRFGRCRPAPPFSAGPAVACTGVLTASGGGLVALVITRSCSGLWRLSSTGRHLGPLLPLTPGLDYASAAWLDGGRRLAVVGHLMDRARAGYQHIGPTTDHRAALFVVPAPALARARW